jgi:hypothetical protein
MLNFRSKPRMCDSSATLGCEFKKNRYLWEGTFVFHFCLVNLAVGKFGPHPVGGYGCQGGQSFYVGGLG